MDGGDEREGRGRACARPGAGRTAPTTRELSQEASAIGAAIAANTRPMSAAFVERIEDDLLDRGDVGDQRRESDRQRQRVAARLRLAERLARSRRPSRASPASGGYSGCSVSGSRIHDQASIDQRVAGEHDEDRAPRRDQQDRLADVRREHRAPA